MTTDVIYDCMTDLQTRVQSIAAAQQITNVMMCFSTSDLETLIAGTPLPAVGVMYAGQTSYTSGSIHGTPKRSHNVGLASQCRLSIILLMNSKVIFGQDNKPQSLITLKAIRDAIKDTTGPSGHFWKFVNETPAGEQGSMIAWQQNWEIPILLT